jgi:hypothetical protein
MATNRFHSYLIVSRTSATSRQPNGTEVATRASPSGVQRVDDRVHSKIRRGLEEQILKLKAAIQAGA